MRNTSGVCYQGTLYKVAAGQADSCRKVFERIGLTAGIIASP